MDSHNDMARFEGKKSNNWVWVLLALILLALAGWYFVKARNNTSSNSAENTTQQQQLMQQNTSDTTSDNSASVNQDSILTSTAAVLSASQANSANSKSFDIQNAKVVKVVGDKTFWIDDGNSGQLFVALTDGLDNGSAESKVKIQEGQTLHLKGTVRTVPEAAQIKSMWNMNDADAQNLINQKVYLEAQQV